MSVKIFVNSMYVCLMNIEKEWYRDLCSSTARQNLEVPISDF